MGWIKKWETEMQKKLYEEQSLPYPIYLAFETKEIN